MACVKTVKYVLVTRTDRSQSPNSGGCAWLEPGTPTAHYTDDNHLTAVCKVRGRIATVTGALLPYSS
jgi:hypothetical protein